MDRTSSTNYHGRVVNKIFESKPEGRKEEGWEDLDCDGNIRQWRGKNGHL